MEEEAAELARLIQQGSNKALRRYDLRLVGGRMLVRHELCRMFDLALRDVCGCEIEPDEKDGMFLD